MLKTYEKIERQETVDDLDELEALDESVLSFDEFYAENRERLFPTTSYPRNEDAINSMIEDGASTDKYTRMMYRLTAATLRHISFAEFRDTLLRCAHEAVALCTNEKRTMYLLIDGHARKSNTWCALLIWPIIRRYVARIIRRPVFAVQDADENTSILIVHIDDASYSGSQIADTLVGDTFQSIVADKRLDVKSLICVAAITEQARIKIKRAAPYVVFPVATTRIKTVEESVANVFGAADAEDFIVHVTSTAMARTAAFQLDLSMTYFDHKLADNVSTNDLMIAYAPTPFGRSMLQLHSLIANCSPYAYGWSTDITPSWVMLTINDECPPPFYKRIPYTYRGRKIWTETQDWLIETLFKQNEESDDSE